MIKLSSCLILFLYSSISLASEDEVAMIPEAQSDVVILQVDKTALKAQLVTLPLEDQQSLVVDDFKVATGKALGDKYIQGDEKTPEGIYFTQMHIPDEKLPPKYGPLAIPLNYPNPIDLSEGKTGYGIWLHGVINDERIEEANVTEGCVAFYNSDIVELSQWMQPNQGIVVIANDTSEINQPEQMRMIRSLTKQWSTAWQERDINSYSSFYSAEKFVSRGMDSSEYKNYKSRVFASYKNMNVGISDIRVITHPKYAMSFMKQDFNGDDRYISKGRKILYWQKTESGEWKITKELFDSQPIALTRFVKNHKAANPAYVVAHPEEAASKVF